jgi:hypothetical protein
MVEPKTYMGGRIMIYGGISASILSILALLTFMGADNLLPATKGEVIILATGVQENRAGILIMQLNGNQDNIWRTQDRIEELRQKGQPTGDLKARERLLILERERLQREFKKLTGSGGVP